MKTYNGEKYIISFTSFGERMNYVHIFLDNFLRQTYKDYHLVLTLYKDDAENIPESLQKYIDDDILELIVADKDLKPHLKYYYAMQKYSDKPIITVDDDRMYEDDLIKSLVDTYELFGQNNVIANCAVMMHREGDHMLPFLEWWKRCIRLKKNNESHQYMAEGFMGILYPENFFERMDLTNELDNIMKCIYDDDIYLKALEIRKGIKVRSTGYSKISEYNNIPEMDSFELHNRVNSDDQRYENIKIFEKDLLNGFHDEQIIVSMTTIPERKEKFSQNILSLLNQSYYYDKLVINCQHKEDIEFYKNFKQIDDRIEVNLCDEKWRSCNKLIPTLKKYPDDIIITVDDDVYYPPLTIELLVKKHRQFPEYIITHQANPIVVDKYHRDVRFENKYTLQCGEISYSKYLSNGTLFPAHTFDTKLLFNYNKMMKTTFGTHDEIWFWINSTLNYVKVIELDYVNTFDVEILEPWKEDEFRLCNINFDSNMINRYNMSLNHFYGKELFEIITTDIPLFIIDETNVRKYIDNAENLLKTYNYGIKFVVSHTLTKSWLIELRKVFRYN